MEKSYKMQQTLDQNYKLCKRAHVAKSARNRLDDQSFLEAGKTVGELWTLQRIGRLEQFFFVSFKIVLYFTG